MSKNTTSDLEAALGGPFNDQGLLTEALTHRSYLNEHPQIQNSNERLEFLGDSVLSLIVSTELFARFPTFPEGELTSLRSNLVRTQTLATVAKRLNLGTHLLMSRGEDKSGGRENFSLLANTFEAILGAIYLDQGLDQAKSFLEKHLFSAIAPFSTKTIVYDFKSRLQELIQEKESRSPVYKVVKETGPDHNKIFFVNVFSQSHLLAQGTGHSKQEAEQEAARLALLKFKS